MSMDVKLYNCNASLPPMQVSEAPEAASEAPEAEQGVFNNDMEQR